MADAWRHESLTLERSATFTQSEPRGRRAAAAREEARRRAGRRRRRGLRARPAPVLAQGHQGPPRARRGGGLAAAELTTGTSSPTSRSTASTTTGRGGLRATTALAARPAAAAPAPRGARPGPPAAPRALRAAVGRAPGVLSELAAAPRASAATWTRRSPSTAASRTRLAKLARRGARRC